MYPNWVYGSGGGIEKNNGSEGKSHDNIVQWSRNKIGASIIGKQGYLGHFPIHQGGSFIFEITFNFVSISKIGAELLIFELFFKCTTQPMF